MNQGRNYSQINYNWTLGSTVGQDVAHLWLRLLTYPCRTKSVPVLPIPSSPLKQEEYPAEAPLLLSPLGQMSTILWCICLYFLWTVSPDLGPNGIEVLSINRRLFKSFSVHEFFSRRNWKHTSILCDPIRLKLESHSSENLNIILSQG